MPCEVKDDGSCGSRRCGSSTGAISHVGKCTSILDNTRPYTDGQVMELTINLPDGIMAPASGTIRGGLFDLARPASIAKGASP